MSATNQRAPVRVLPGAVRALVPACLLLVGCQPFEPVSTTDIAARGINVVATTGIVADLVARVGGDRVVVGALMGPGVDPHLYKASEGDIARMASADLIFYSGLHLEGRMTEVFEQMARRSVRAVAVTAGLDRDVLLSPPEFQGNYDPHVWFDVRLWARTVPGVTQALSDLDPTHASDYRRRAAAYVEELDALDQSVRAQSQQVPAAQRVLVTAHDAFNYFGRAYEFEVRALQGISTATEAGTSDVQRLADFIAARRIPALFIEASVSPRGIEAVQAAVRARGFSVVIGGSLFSDSLGTPGTPEGTYVGTVRHNIQTIASGLASVPPQAATP
jgi:manganese/zinc/iron transport system substrate-binding protein